MNKLALFLLASMFCFTLSAQQNTGYQKPSQAILDLVDVEMAPGVMMDNAERYMVLSYRSQYKTITELSETEMRLGGLRINPKTNIGSRTNYANNLKLRYMDKDDVVHEIEGLPQNPRLANFRWSPDQTKIACTNTVENGVELWVVDLTAAKAMKLSEPNLNANTGGVINWMKDGESLLIKVLPSDRKALINTAESIPTGPTISVADGKKAQNRTYQDLLKNKDDEFNFEQLARSTIYKIGLDGSKEMWLDTDMYRGISFSPDGSYVMVSTIEKPFSYLVPYSRFPSKTVVYDKNAQFIEEIVSVPLIEDLPKGFMAARKGRRNVSWRADKPHTLVFAQVLDGGDPAVEVEYRDEAFELEAPFNGEPRSLMKCINRFSGITWGDDNTAMAYDYWWNTRNTKAYMFDPSDNTVEPKVMINRNYQDVYSDPGSPVTKRNEYGRYVLAMEGRDVYLIGDGYSDEGQFPFVDKWNSGLENQKASLPI